MHKKKIFYKLGIFIFTFLWLFSGWPVVWQNPRFPPEIKEAQAANLESEDFEVSFGNWTDDASGCMWTRDVGGTPSSSTGPDHDNTYGDATHYYIFVETSSSVCPVDGDKANLTGPSIDGSVYSTELSFYYHMYGASMGTLAVDVWNGTSWDLAVWSISGQQHGSSGAAYTNAVVDLDSYTNSDMQVRFRYGDSSSYTGDAAIDDILITGELRVEVPDAPTLYNNDGGANQIAFNNIRTDDTTPTFRVSTTHTESFNRFQIELNDDPTFEDAAEHTQNFDSTYSSGTQYSLTLSGFSPSNNTTYYVRARASADGGSNYGEWSSGTWSYTYSTSATDPDWFQTTDEQFDTGTLDGTQTSAGSVEILPLSGTVDLVGSWTSDSDYEGDGANYTPGSGSNRLVLVMVTTESDDAGTTDFGTVTLGGQSLTAIENPNGVNVGTGGAYHNVIWLGYLNESGIGNMSGNALTVNFDTPPNNPTGPSLVQFVTYEGVDQSTPIADSASNVDTGNTTIQAGSVSVGDGDRLVYVTVAGNPTNHTAPSGYTEQIEMDGSSNNQSNASAQRNTTTSSTENPTATWSASNRLAIISAVLNAAVAGGGSSGTIMSPEIDFDWVPGQTSWGTAAFSTTETNGDVKLKVYYTVSTACDTIVPDGVLSGNSSGFDVSASPVNIAGLTPVDSTYNKICLQATLTDSGGTPYLNDWTVTWGTAAVYSVAITTDGTIAYGNVEGGQSKSTIDLTDTQTAQNDGDATENLNIMTSNAVNGTSWTVGSSAGENIFVHEFSTNSGGDWTKFAEADSYHTLATGVEVSSTVDFDLRITVPTDSDGTQKNITITVQAIAP
jgi:hypothetical protein